MLARKSYPLENPTVLARKSLTISSILKKLSKIPIRTKHTVNGWIREAELELTLSNIPSMITAICILYYAENDKFITDINATHETDRVDPEYAKWVVETDPVEFSLDRRRVTKLTSNGLRKLFGENSVRTDQDRTYRWTLLMNNPSYVMISTTDDDDRYVIKTRYYKYCRSGKFDTDCNLPTENDKNKWIEFGNGKETMYVTLNSQMRKLTFQVIGGPEISCKIKTGVGYLYQLGVGLQDKGAYVQIEACEAL